MTPPITALQPAVRAEISPPPQPRRRRLGRMGRSVSELGLGGAGLHGVCGRPRSDEEAVACVERALELGINYIDTSPAYGQSERRIGLALRGGLREKVFLATKTGTRTPVKDYTRDGTLRSVEASMERLGTDYLDLVQVHDPDELGIVLGRGGAVEALLELKEQGVIGGIGIGVRSHEFLLSAIRHGAFDTILTYADFNLVQQTAREALFEEAVGHDVAIVLGSPLLFGYLSDRPWDDLVREHGSNGTSEEERGALRIRRWSARHRLSTLHLAIQFCMREQRIATVLTGAETAAEIEQNVRAATTRLPERVWSALAEELGVE
jgi:aryl-alcohol dehydrogenase-like predicted oxidoreductase